MRLSYLIHEKIESDLPKVCIMFFVNKRGVSSFIPSLNILCPQILAECLIDYSNSKNYNTYQLQMSKISPKEYSNLPNGILLSHKRIK